MDGQWRGKDSYQFLKLERFFFLLYINKLYYQSEGMVSELLDFQKIKYMN